jgi:DNA polymerase-3 subunit gamma/tau
MTTLYLKYRPQTIEELDIVPARESLLQIVKSGKIPHALLFSGPKGTGKTSAARILAKVVNCEQLNTDGRKLKTKFEPCNKCNQCISITKGNNIDVIELDAASHRGIDDIRILRDAVKLSPAKAAKKVYIIDEAHMITSEASNALLKTLEEPPEHVMFILATTNPEKIIGTIRSRTTNINFRKAQPDEITRSLEKIAKGEKIKIEKEALMAISKVAEGSFRDAAKVLEQIITENRSFKKEDIEEYLYKTKSFSVESFIEILAARNTKKALEEIENAVNKGVIVGEIIESIISKLRLALLTKSGVGNFDLESFSKTDLIQLIDLLSEANLKLKSTPIEQLPLEVAIINWCEKGNISSSSETEQKEEEINIPETVLKNPVKEIIGQKETINKVELQKINIEKIKEVSEDVWKKILFTIKPINTSVEALLRAAKPISFDGKTLILGVFYRFHKERLEEGSHRRVLEDVVASIIGKPVRIVCTLTEPPVKEIIKEEKQELLEGAKTILTEGEDKDIIKIAEEIFSS